MTNDEYIRVVKRNSNRIYLIALSYLKNHDDAEDIMQEVFLKFWKTNKEFNSEEHLEKWLTITCINKCKDHFRIPFIKNSVALEDAKDLYTFDTIKNFDVTSIKDKITFTFEYEDGKTESASVNIGFDNNGHMVVS